MMAFTLIELLITFGLILILVLVSVPLAVNFFKTQQLDSLTYQLMNLLRQAQNQAMAVQDDSSFGIYLTNENFTLFKGTSYPTRDQGFDFIIDLAENISVSGPNEIIFSKLNGLPNTTGTITLTSDNQTTVISVNEMGRINLEP